MWELHDIMGEGKQPAPCSSMSPRLFAGVFIDFKNSEGIPLSIHEVTLPTRTGYCEFGQGDDARQLQYRFRGWVEILHLERADKRVRTAWGRGDFAGAATIPPLDPPVSIVQ